MTDLNFNIKNSKFQKKKKSIKNSIKDGLKFNEWRRCKELQVIPIHFFFLRILKYLPIQYERRRKLIDV